MFEKSDYLASLPERTLRASAAVAGGLLAETANGSMVAQLGKR